MPNLSCCVGVAALLFTSVAASLPPSRGPLFTWVCLERCGDNAHDIALQVAQLNANADLFTGVAFELFNLGPRSTLVRNNLTVVAPLLKRLGQRHAMVSSFPCVSPLSESPLAWLSCSPPPLAATPLSF